MKELYDIVIIGGGASGLAAAITARRNAPHMSVAIFEKKEVTGKKLSATGNGRCNLTNINCRLIEQVIDFFMSVGISMRKDEEGRLYPYSEDAKDVTGILTACARGEGAEILLNREINRVEADPEGGFLLFTGEKPVKASKVLIATGGKSYASMGTTGDGYVMARKLGHTVTRLAPGLTAVELVEDISNLKGMRSKAQVALYKDGEQIFTEKGEVQFRSDSISGICVMNMSRLIRAEESESPEEAMKRYVVSVNLVPDFGTVEIISILKQRLLIKGLTVKESLKTLIREAAADYVLAKAGIDGDLPALSVAFDDGKALAIVNGIRSMRFAVKGVKGWNEAQITLGGVSMDEINPVTMESKLVSGLFFSGEVTDFDGPCGGFNLHNAWITGMLAGSGMTDGGEAGVQNSRD
ncbi:MAG: aminoacetone oxidase family FAD-binding enzyme [Firmicutes bacterium]|nr:aminoacetone oxidase family FAD-binding enzyme [Bacillota bacterium]